MMNTKQLAVIIAVTAALVLGLTTYNGYAADKSATAKAAPKIAVVNLRLIFQKNKLNEDFEAKLEQEKNQALQEMETIGRKIDLLKTEMKALNVGSNDYLSRMSQVLEQQGLLQAKKEYYPQYIDARQQRFTEDLYTKVKGTIGDYAARNGIDLVLVKDDKQFNVLYSTPEMDITDAILAAVDGGTGAAK